MANSVVGKAFRVNELDYFNCPKDIAVNCTNAVTQGTEWFIPTVANGVLKGYSRRKSSTKPTPDSVKTVRVKDFESGNIYWLLIADNGTEALFNDHCAACCDNQTPMPDVTVPAPLIEEPGCCEAPQPVSCNYNYFAIAPALPVGAAYSLNASKNGTPLTPAAPGAGFASLAALVSWANTNWAAFGTFSVSGQKVTFTSADGATGSINVGIV